MVGTTTMPEILRQIVSDITRREQRQPSCTSDIPRAEESKPLLVWDLELDRSVWIRSGQIRSNQSTQSRRNDLNCTWKFGRWLCKRLENRSSKDYRWEMNNWKSNRILFSSLCWFWEEFVLRSNPIKNRDIGHWKMSNYRPVNDCSPIKSWSVAATSAKYRITEVTWQSSRSYHNYAN